MQTIGNLKVLAEYRDQPTAPESRHHFRGTSERQYIYSGLHSFNKYEASTSQSTNLELNLFRPLCPVLLIYLTGQTPVRSIKSAMKTPFSNSSSVQVNLQPLTLASTAIRRPTPPIPSPSGHPLFLHPSISHMAPNRPSYTASLTVYSSRHEIRHGKRPH